MLLFCANLATALEPIPKESGFSGFIRPGVGAMRYKTKVDLNAVDETDYIRGILPFGMVNGRVIVRPEHSC